MLQTMFPGSAAALYNISKLVDRRLLSQEEVGLVSTSGLNSAEDFRLQYKGGC
jgi:hypothetical protein